MHKFSILKITLLFLISLGFFTSANSALDHLTLDKPSDGIVCMAQLKDVLTKKEFNHVKDKGKIIEAICDVHTKYNVPYQLIASVIWTESTFKVVAKNGPNIGLMQLNTKYHEAKNLRSIYGNIDYGVAFLSKLIKTTGSITGGLSRYNGGNINKVYVNRVNTAYKKFFMV